MNQLMATFTSSIVLSIHNNKNFTIPYWFSRFNFFRSLLTYDHFCLTMGLSRMLLCFCRWKANLSGSSMTPSLPTNFEDNFLLFAKKILATFLDTFFVCVKFWGFWIFKISEKFFFEFYEILFLWNFCKFIKFLFFRIFYFHIFDIFFEFFFLFFFLYLSFFCAFIMLNFFIFHKI